MSALAARRAAQAAAKAADPTVESASAFPVTKAPSPSPPPSPTPSLSSMSDSDPEIEVAIAAPKSKRRKVDKRRVVREKREPKPKKPKARFFDPAEGAEDGHVKASKRQRRYSPGAPIDSDESSADEGGDASSDDDEVLFEGAATPYSGAPSPKVMDPGPSRQGSGTQLRPYTSSFEPEDGVNVLRLKDGAVHGLHGPSVLISLGEEESLALVGTFAVVPLQHSLSLLSTTLHPSEDAIEAYPVFAPTCYPVPVLTGVSDSHFLRRSEALDGLKLPKTFRSDSPRTLFLLQENSTGLEAIKGDMVPGFSNIWHDPARGAWGLQGVHPVLSTFSTPVYPHVTPPSWTHALAALVSASPDTADDEDTPPPPDRVPVVVVKGPKRSGKSSLARASLNRLLETYERVAWLDCDLGQGEFGCGGTVGLWIIDKPVLGPPFSHPRVPARAQYLGELNPQPCPDAYMAAIHQVLAYYAYEVQYPLASLQSVGTAKRGDAVPLVVNTQGWTKGLGEELMRAIEVAAEPTHVFAFEQGDDGAVGHNSPVQQVATLPYATAWGAQAAQSGAAPPTVFPLEPAPQCPLQARYSAADMRTLSTIAYMHARLDEGRWDFSAPLFVVRPWVVQLGGGGPLRAAYLLGEGADGVVAEDMPLALNGSLVGLLEVPTTPGNEEEEVYVPGRVPSDEASLLGLALVRAVRSEGSTTSLQLISPLLPSRLARASALVRNGALELPSPAMLDWRERVPGGGVPDDGLAGVRWDDVPFFDAANSGAVGAERRRFRKNLQRKNQQA